MRKKKIIVIHTDSKYSITSFTSKNLESKVPSDVPNYDYVIKGNNICKKYSNIKFHHIRAHTGKQDIHSIGNENADRLANLALNVNIEDVILTFGKYKNKTLEYVYQTDKNYLLWCAENIKTQINDIDSFLFSKNIISNTVASNSNIVNDKQELIDKSKKQEEQLKTNLTKLKIYKINGVRCIKDENKYYCYANNKKENLFAITNENNEIELIEQESEKTIIIVGKIECIKVGDKYFKYVNNCKGELYAETINGKVVLHKKKRIT